MKKKIKQILVECEGWIYSSDGEIERFDVHGEMAMIDWYRQGNREYNGKYVVIIEYYED